MLRALSNAWVRFKTGPGWPIPNFAGGTRRFFVKVKREARKMGRIKAIQMQRAKCRSKSIRKFFPIRVTTCLTKAMAAV